MWSNESDSDFFNVKKQDQDSRFARYFLYTPAEIFFYASVGGTIGLFLESTLKNEHTYEWTIAGAELAAGLAILRLLCVGAVCMYWNHRSGRSLLDNSTEFGKSTSSAAAYDLYRNHYLSASLFTMWGAVGAGVGFCIFLGLGGLGGQTEQYMAGGALVGFVLAAAIARAFREEHSSATGAQLGFRDIAYKATPIHPVGACMEGLGHGGF